MNGALAALAWLLLQGAAQASESMPFDVNTRYSEVPVVAHPFYERDAMVAYCVDHGMTMTSERDACARPYRHTCSVAYPYTGRYDRREAAAICNGWVPHFKDLF